MSFLKNLFGIPDVEEAKAQGNVKGLVKALVKSDDANTRAQAAEALGTLTDPAAVEPLVSALADQSDRAAGAASSALVQIGAPAVEPLLSYLQDENISVVAASRAASALGRIGDPRAVPALIEALQGRDLLLRRLAAVALGQIGDARAVPALAAALRDEHKDVRSAAAGALAALGEPALKALRATLREKRPEVRQEAAWALGKLGSRRATEPLIAALQDAQQQVRESAASALGHVGDERAIRPLFGAMSTRHNRVVDLVWRIGSDAVREIVGRIGRDAVPALVAVLEDGHISCREVAAEALGEVGDDRAVVPLLRVLYGRQATIPALPKAAAGALDRLRPGPDALAPALQDASAYVRAGAAERLGQTKDARAVEPLVAALEDSSEQVRSAAAKALRALRWQPDASPAGARYWILQNKWEKCVEIGAAATGPLVDALTSRGRSEAKVRGGAARALKKLGWEPGRDKAGAIYWIEQGDWERCAEIGAPAVDSLIEALVEGEEERSHGAAQALARIGAPAVEALAGLLQGDDDAIRRRAIEALGEIGTPEAVRPLLYLIRAPGVDLDVRWAGRKAIDHIGPDVVLQADVLADPEVGVRGEAAYSLGKPGNVRAVAPLAALLEDEDMDVRGEAIGALGRIGGVQAIDALVAALQDEEAEVRARAAAALGEAKDARAIGPLVSALEDARQGVRDKASAALGKLGWEPGVHEVGPRQWVDRGEWDQCAALGEAAVSPLIDVLNEEDAARREGAVGALGQIGAPAVDPLVRVLGYMGMGSHRRAAAARALGLIGDSRAVPGLVEALRQRDADVRQEAVVALGQIGDQEALPWLIVALHDRDRDARAAAQQVVDQMGWQRPEPSSERVTLAGEGVVGFWLSEPTDAEAVVRMLLAQNLMENPSRIRIVPNTCDTRGGCFVMFEAHRAPGETEADYEKRVGASKSFQEGVSKAMAGEYLSARWLFEEAAAWHPYSPEVWNNLAFALANLRHNDEEAIQCCDVAIELRPDYADPWEIKGRCLGRMRWYREALSATEQFIHLADAQRGYAARVEAAKEAAGELRSRLGH